MTTSNLPFVKPVESKNSGQNDELRSGLQPDGARYAVKPTVPRQTPSKAMLTALDAVEKMGVPKAKK